MENVVKQLAILNLTGELPKELSDYFAKREVKVVDPLSQQARLDWTHILTKDLQDFSLLRETYKTIENDVKLVSLSSVADIQNFIVANGKLIFDENWMKGPVGEFILDKFFQEYAGITLGDNYPKFVEKGAFNVVNPFNTGEYLDRMVFAAFEHQVEALSVKTFFDHLNMYLAGLKNKGKAGFPIEVNYGIFDEVFGVQVHFYTQNLMIEDITTCLSSGISRKPEENLLNISVQSSDFFDFTFLSQVNKVVITALWTREQKVKLGTRGLMFANLATAATITGYGTEGLTSTLTNDQEIKDITEKIILPQQEREEGKIKISAETFTDVLAEKISSSMELEKIKQIISGDFDEDEFSQVVSGGFETEEGKIIISSADEMKDILNLVKGKVDEEKEIIRISGEKFNADNFAFRIASGLAEKATDKDSLKVKSLGEKLPESIKTGLFDFAKKLNKQIEELSANDIEAFTKFNIPEIVKSHTVVPSNDEKGLLKDLRSRLERGLREEFGGDSVVKIMEGVKTPEEEWRVKELLKSTLKSSLDQNFQLSHKDSMSQEEQDLIVRSLSKTLTEQEDKIREIITNQALPEAVPLFQMAESGKEKELQDKLEKMNQENAQLKGNIKTLLTEVKILKETKLRMAEMNLKAKEAAKNAVAEIKIDDSDEKLREVFQMKLAQQGALNQQELTKLAGLLEREQKLINQVREEETKAKKMQLETTQKETMFMQEIEKANRQLKAKDMMLTKTREAMEKSNQKKDFEINDLKQKLDQVSHALATGPSQTQVQTIKDLEKQNQNLNKMLDVYKIKVSSLATNIQTKTDDGNAKEEVRRLTMVNNQFKNQLESSKREVQKLQDKVVADNTQIQDLRQEKIKLENLFKKFNQEIAQKEQPAGNAELENNYKRAQTQVKTLETQLRDATTKLKDIETRYSELQKGQKAQGSGSSDDASKGKMAQLEGNVKKLTHDLIESKNQLTEMKKETNKLRQEKTALQNQIDKLKKDAEKVKVAGKKSAA